MAPKISPYTLSSRRSEIFLNKRHAKGMLLEAKYAGDRLLEAKASCKHGEFKAWVQENTRVLYRTARRYMQVSKVVVDDQFDPDATIDSVLDTNAARQDKPKASTPTFTEADAEYAQKLHAMATRGEENGGRDVWAICLSGYSL